MPEYRVYCLGRDGRIGFADRTEATGDDEALLKAREIMQDAPLCEVWQERRLVGKLNPDGQFEPLTAKPCG
jgi:hypothetical protein